MVIQRASATCIGDSLAKSLGDPLVSTALLPSGSPAPLRNELYGCGADDTSMLWGDWWSVYMVSSFNRAQCFTVPSGFTAESAAFYLRELIGKILAIDTQVSLLVDVAYQTEEHPSFLNEVKGFAALLSAWRAEIFVATDGALLDGNVRELTFTEYLSNVASGVRNHTSRAKALVEFVKGLHGEDVLIAELRELCLPSPPALP